MKSHDHTRAVITVAGHAVISRYRRPRGRGVTVEVVQNHFADDITAQNQVSLNK